MKLTLESPDGTKDTVEVPDELWERFENLAKERGIPVEELFEIAMDVYLKAQGY